MSWFIFAVKTQKYIDHLESEKNDHYSLEMGNQVKWPNYQSWIGHDHLGQGDGYSTKCKSPSGWKYIFLNKKRNTILSCYVLRTSLRRKIK